MIDANDNPVDDNLNDSYVPVSSCMEEDIRDGLRKLNFNESLYLSCYREHKAA